MVHAIAGIAAWLATVPLPVPAPLTVSVYIGTGAVNVAVTFRACVIDTTHAPVPVQWPLHPVKVLPPVGVAFSVTVVPEE